MITYSDFEKYDPTAMHKVYNNWPKLARDAYESNLEPTNFKNIDHIVFAGMGGSGAIGDLFLSLLSKTSIHVNVVKGYLLPKTVSSKTLVVATSASGNTVEILNIIKSAKELNCKIICFSSGGKLEEFCLKSDIAFRKVSMHNNPRTSFPVYVYSILKVLSSIIPIDKSCIENSISQLELLSEKISTKNLTESNPSLALAKWLDTIPMIYYPLGLQVSAIRFKNSIQENTKSHAMIEDIMEASHNGIMAWETPSKVQPILLRGKNDSDKTKQRLDIFVKYFKKNNIKHREIMSVEGNIITKIVNLIYLLDYVAIYLAIIRKKDPTPVNSIVFIKSEL